MNPSARIQQSFGLIIPSSNRLTEPHMRRYAPDGTQAYVTRLRMTGPSHVPLTELLPRIVEATRALDDAGCGAIVFHCTASSMEAGLDGERQVLETMNTATHAATATTATAALAALQELQLKRIALFSPYIAATHQHELEFLAEAGVDVIGGTCLGLRGGEEYVKVPPSEWLQLATEQTPAEADGVFLSCTNIHAPDVIVDLEAALGKPVVTSNQAVLWYVLRQLGVQAHIPQLGRLFGSAVGALAGRTS